MRYHGKGSSTFSRRYYYTASSSSMENISYMTVVLIVSTSVVYRFNIRAKYQHILYLGLSPSLVKSII